MTSLMSYGWFGESGISVSSSRSVSLMLSAMEPSNGSASRRGASARLFDGR